MEVNGIELKDSSLRMKSNSKALTIYSRKVANKNLLREKVWKIIYDFSKRTFDIICGLVGCIALIPIVAIVKIAYLLSGDTYPILFKQERIGKHGKKICIYKIRSMVHNAEKVLENLMEKNPDIRQEYIKNKKLENDPRITKIGKFLRKTSLDEFGQFINVLKGEMTMIGPRPYLPREKEDMAIYYKDIVSCKPGITGLWQANGRNKINFENRCRLDSFYSKHKCLIFDMKIFRKTFSAVLSREGAE